MHTLLGPTHRDYCDTQLTEAEAAHNRGDLASEVRVLRETLRYLSMLLGIRRAGGPREPTPPHADLLRMLGSLGRFGQDDLNVAEVEAAFVTPGVGWPERTMLAECTARLGTLSVTLGELAEGLPWLRLADELLPEIINELEKSRLLQHMARGFSALRYQVATFLENAYNEQGQSSLAEWSGIVRENAVVAAGEDEELGNFVTIFHILDSVSRLQRQKRWAEALSQFDAETAKVDVRFAPDWLEKILAAKRNELNAANAGNMLEARTAVGQQILSLKRGLPRAVLTQAGAQFDAMHYALLAGHNDLVLVDAAKTLALAEGLQARPRGLSWRVFLYLAEGAEATGLLWACCLFAKIAINQLHDAGNRFADANPDFADAPCEEELELSYDFLADTLVSLGRLQEAAEAVQLGLTRGGGRTPLTMTEPEAAASARILTELRAARSADDRAVRALAAALSETQGAMETGGLARDQAVLRLNHAIRDQTVAALPYGTADTTALLHYIVQPFSVRVVVRIGASEEVPTLDLPSNAAVNALVFEVLTSITNTAHDPVPCLKRAYDLLIAPLHDRLVGIKRLLIAAPGTLHGLPWGALHDGERFLVERWSWVRMAAPGVDLRRPPDSRVQLAAFAATRATGGLPPLGSSAAKEASDIANAFPGGAMVDDGFSRVALEQAVRSATILHVASHFVPEPTDLERSSMFLGDGTTISMADLLRFDLSRLDLVVLSACRSGIASDVAGGEGAFAMDALLLGGGIRATVGTLWPVDSASILAFMIAFYGHLRAGLDKDESLSWVQRALITGEIGAGAWRLPLHWAAPVLSGNWLGWPSAG